LRSRREATPDRYAPLYNSAMTTNAISHDWADETIEAKARWFQSLSLAERMDVFVMFTDLILSINPNILEQRDAQYDPKRVRVLTAP